MQSFDITIIGGGHAGLEAAYIASQFNLKVAIVTIPGVSIASAPCNPAVGGVGKGQVVRELDALGGAMGKLADKSAIQYRMLNESKGYAVRSTRVQIDKELYSENAEKLVESIPNITVVREKVLNISKDSDFKIKTTETEYISKKVVVTTGTFLNGKLHTGSEQVSGGRVDCETAPALENMFSAVKTLKNRFKTGTPARILRHSIDFSVMEEQPSDPAVHNFHWGNDSYYRECEQVSCFLTRTNEKTLGIIRDNKEQSPMYNGQITGIGPRYCPSIEDKAFRYPDRHSHHVFVEPEGLNIDTFYPNGISTSLPKEIQLDFIRTIAGLEKAEIGIYGYAVEYDVVDTSFLDRTLQYRDIEGLYFAGQVNGTSGYEEAAGQGYIAGVNASLAFLGEEPLILDRNDSYIGVMVEDLVTNDRDEPYRLFTARSENRLYLREDNAFHRMFPYRDSLGLHLSIDTAHREYQRERSVLEKLCDSFKFRKNTDNEEYFKELGYGKYIGGTIKLVDLIKEPKEDCITILQTQLDRLGASFDKRVVSEVAISINYRGYIKRAHTHLGRVAKLDRMKLNLDYMLDSKNISTECKQRIKSVRPETFGQLKKMQGIRPATLAYVASTF